jgi:hypothetical protein
MPIAFIRSKKLWVTGADESTASTPGFLAQSSVACAAGPELAKPAAPVQNNKNNLPAEALLTGIGIP